MGASERDYHYVEQHVPQAMCGQYLFDLQRCVLEGDLEMRLYKVLESAEDWWAVEPLTYSEGY